MPTTPTTKEPTNYYKLEERTYSSFEIEPPPTYVMKVLKLSPGITKTNFVCCIAYYMIMIFGFVATGVLQPLILIDPSYYNVDQDSVGTITSMVLVIQFIVKILVSIPYGHLTDRLGRKTIIFYGSANFLVSCLLVPLQTSVFPGIVLSKIVLANGISALRCVPLLADYFADESKGKATGISGMFIGVAAVLANIFLKIMFYNQVSLGACYAIIGIFVFVGVGLITLGLKGGHYYSLKPRQAEENIDTGNLKENIKEALTIFRGNGWLMIALVLTILGSSDFFVFFTFMTLYVRSLYPGDVDVAAANLRVNNLQTLVMIPAFFCNLFYGFYLDKPNKGYQMSLYALVGGALSFIMIAASTVPHDWKLNLGSVLMGATIPGLFVIANYLGIKNFPQEKRGIMIGLAGIVGYFGFFLIASGGGFLYDHWRKDGPFLICAGLLVIALVLVVRIHRVMIEKK